MMGNLGLIVSGGWLRSLETCAASRSPSRVKGLHSLEVKHTTRGAWVYTGEAQHWCSGKLNDIDFILINFDNECD